MRGEGGCDRTYSGLADARNFAGMDLRDLLLVLCLAGGIAGIGAGASRRDISIMLLGLIIVTIAVGELIR